MNRSSAYKEMAIVTASPTRRIVLLYQGAVRFLREAQDDIQRQDYIHKRQSIERAAAIIQYLQITLDTDRGGVIARDLNRLYTYMKLRIFDASTRLDCKPLDEVIKLLETLAAGWEQLAEQSENEAAVPPEQLVSMASGTHFEFQA